MDFGKYYGKTIKDIDIIDNELMVEFEDNSSIRVSDHAQYCCENRYMSSDDNLDSLIDQKLVKIEVKEGNGSGDDWGVDDIEFLEISTDKGFAIIANHNEHNGYYGGFDLRIKEYQNKNY